MYRELLRGNTGEPVSASALIGLCAERMRAAVESLRWGWAHSDVVEPTDRPQFDLNAAAGR